MNMPVLAITFANINLGRDKTAGLCSQLFFFATQVSLLVSRAFLKAHYEDNNMRLYGHK